MLIVFFTYFYTALIFEPNQIAENLKKNGGFIPSVRPGKDTAVFLEKTLARLTLWGSIYLVVICLIPQYFYTSAGVAGFSYFFGGTAILIVVGVTMDTLNQVQSYVVTRNYDQFMKKGMSKGKGQKVSLIRR